VTAVPRPDDARADDILAAATAWLCAHPGPLPDRFAEGWFRNKSATGDRLPDMRKGYNADKLLPIDPANIDYRPKAIPDLTDTPTETKTPTFVRGVYREETTTLTKGEHSAKVVELARRRVAERQPEPQPLRIVMPERVPSKLRPVVDGLRKWAMGDREHETYLSD
jgi:hypothetical protein